MTTSGLCPSSNGASTCSGTPTITSNGSLISDGSGTYGNSMTCQWQVTAPAGYRVVFILTRLGTESCCDFVTGYDGTSTSNTNLFSLSGSSLNFGLYYSSGINMLIRWTTDGSVTGEGFQGNVFFIPTGTTWPCSVSSACLTCTIYWSDARVNLGDTGSTDYNTLIPYAGGWAPNTINTNAFLGMDFLAPRWVTELATQGEWVGGWWWW